VVQAVGVVGVNADGDARPQHGTRDRTKDGVRDGFCDRWVRLAVYWQTATHGPDAWLLLRAWLADKADEWVRPSRARKAEARFEQRLADAMTAEGRRSYGEYTSVRADSMISSRERHTIGASGYRAQ